MNGVCPNIKSEYKDIWQRFRVSARFGKKAARCEEKTILTAPRTMVLVQDLVDDFVLIRMLEMLIQMLATQQQRTYRRRSPRMVAKGKGFEFDGVAESQDSMCEKGSCVAARSFRC